MKNLKYIVGTVVLTISPFVFVMPAYAFQSNTVVQRVHNAVKRVVNLQTNVDVAAKVSRTTVQDKSAQDFVVGEVIVKFSDTAKASQMVGLSPAPGGSMQTRTDSALDALLLKYHVEKVTAINIPSNSNARTVVAVQQFSKIVKFKLSGADFATTAIAAKEFSKLPSVVYAEVNARVQALAVPNDTYYASSGAWGQDYKDLWGLHKVSAPSAWTKTSGAGVVVAVSDTGVDINHPDLAANIWINPNEIPNDGIDNDNNGFIDDVNGWNFVANNNNVLDDHFHGTHVSGTIAAVRNNAIGIVGVSPEVKIMPVKGLDARGDGNIDALAAGIVYAANNGAKVINMSWGGWGTELPQLLQDAFNYAHDVRDVVMVASAGNAGDEVSNIDGYYFPAALADAITVSATDHLDAPSGFSNYGFEIDVAAPGGGDTTPTSVFSPNRSILSLLTTVVPRDSFPADKKQLFVGDHYFRVSGTSMSAPHVTGVAALVRAAHPEFSTEQVRQALRLGADDKGDIGADVFFGAGRVNARGAVNIATPLAVELERIDKVAEDVSMIQVKGVIAGENIKEWNLAFRRADSQDTWNVISMGTTVVVGGLMHNWDISNVPDGIIDVRLTATDAAGKIYTNQQRAIFDRVRLMSPEEIGGWGEMLTNIGKPGVFTVTGVANAGGMKSFSLSVLNNIGSTVTPIPTTLTGGGTQRVVKGVLGTINMSSLANGFYTVRLSVTQSNGAMIIADAPIAIDRTLESGWPISIPPVDMNGYLRITMAGQSTVADINGDGIEEIIVGYGNALHMFRGDGTELAGWPQPLLVLNDTDNNYNGVTVGDLDGDGSKEIVAIAGRNVYIFEPDGALRAGWPKQIYTIDNSMGAVPIDGAIALADLNGDMKDEIIGTYWDKVYVFNALGEVLPGWPQTLPATGSYAANPPAPLVGDITGDGYPEIVVSNGMMPLTIFAYSLSGVLIHGFPVVIETPTEACAIFCFHASPVLAELNGDDTSEIIIGDSQGYIHALKGDGKYVTGFPVNVGQMHMNTIAVGDILGTGSPIIIASGNTTNSDTGVVDKIAAVTSDGNIPKGWPVTTKMPLERGQWYFGGYQGVAITDVSGDGIPDVIASRDMSISDHKSVEAFTGLGLSVDGFPKLVRAVGADRKNSPAIGNFDNDQYVEVVWGDYSGRLYVWQTQGVSSRTSLNTDWRMVNHDAAKTNNYSVRAIAKQQLGDVNHDGVINASDALRALRILTEVGSTQIEADVNCDGGVTVSDVLYILRVAVGSMPSPITCVAAQRTQIANLTFTKEGDGVVTPELQGTAMSPRVLFTATPATGQQFVGWQGACSGMGACTVHLPDGANLTLKAVFAKAISDLVIMGGRDLRVSPARPMANRAFSVFAVARNQGEITSGTYIASLRIDKGADGIWDFADVERVLATRTNQRKAIKFRKLYTPVEAGKYTIQVCVNDGSLSDTTPIPTPIPAFVVGPEEELDETNNCQSMIVDVLPARGGLAALGGLLMISGGLMAAYAVVGTRLRMRVKA